MNLDLYRSDLGMVVVGAAIFNDLAGWIVFALVLGLMSGPAIRLILRPGKKWRLQDALSSKLFLRDLKAVSRHEAIHEMTVTVCDMAALDLETVEAAVWAREEALSTGVGNGVALPHARIDGLQESLVVVGFSATGIDFDAPDDKLAKVIFLILTPGKDPGAQLAIASELARLFRDPRLLDRVLRTKSFTDFLALMTASVQSESRRDFTQG